MTDEEPKRVKMKSNSSLFVIELIKKLLTTFIMILLGCNLMFTLETFNKSLFPSDPYNINPSGYMDSLFGFTKSMDNGGSKLANVAIRGVKNMFEFFGDLMGINISKLTTYADVRYDSPFTLANIYSWANVNWLVSTVVTNLRKYVLGLGSVEINESLTKLLYNVLFYFSTTIFTISIIPIAIISIIGMITGITKHVSTKIPGYGVLNLIIYIILQVIALVAIPFSPALYMIGIQIAIIFYELYIKKLFTQIALPNILFKERFEFVAKYAKRGHWAIIIMVLMAFYRSASSTFKAKEVTYVLYSCIGIFLFYCLANIMKVAFKKETPK